MHRIPKIFIHSSDSRKTRSKSRSTSSSNSTPSRLAEKPIPRLERLNAVKNIDYEYIPSTSSTSALSASCSSEESLRGRSRDLYSGQTSLRIEGIDGQFEFICETLGFSGIEDFGIPVAEYEAMKVRSSVASCLIGQKIDDSNGSALEISNGGGGILNLRNQKTEDSISNVIEISVPSCNEVVEVINQKVECNDIEDLRLSNSSNGSSFSIISRGDDDGICELSKRLENSGKISNRIFSNNAHVKSGEICRNGIKGVRPPVLAPPPSMSLPVIDNECSTWDILKSFAPDNDKSFSRFERGFGSEEDEQETEVVGGRRDDGRENFMRKRRIMMREDNGVISGSCSFTTTSIDDDSSSTTTEPASYVSPNERFRRIGVDWQKGDLLGRGSFGSVYEGITGDGFFFAVKEVSLLDQGDEGKQRIIQLEQEIALLSQFEHENIVQYYGTEKVESHLYIFLELVTKGSLLSLYQKYNLRDSQVSAYTRQILHGLKYLHDKNVVHRDIKCANILVDTNGLVKLADFGLAKATKLNDVKSCKGTPFWMAPEVVKSLGYGLAADIWSLGCTVLEMLTGCFPYSNMEPMQALYRIGRGELPPIPVYLSSDARDFILKCLQVDASARPTAPELLDHPFVKRLLPAASWEPSFGSISASYRFGTGTPFHEQNIHDASSTVNDTDWGRCLSDAPNSLDGHFEFTLKMLGFSGIEDFGIPVEEYEAMKVRSSVAPHLISQQIEDSNGNVFEISNDRGSVSNLMNQETENSISNVIEISGHSCDKVEVINHKSERNGIEDLEFSNSGRGSSSSIISRYDDAGLRDLSKKLENSARINNLVLRDNLSGKLGEFGRSGINGVWPQVLVPPPSMSLPVMDIECSTWDILKSFCPEQETEGVGERRDEDEENHMRRGLMTIEENGALSTKPENDYDSWSTSTENTSYPSSSARYICMDWQKGELLGCGSLGSVYEGIIDDGFFFAAKEVSLLDQGDEGKQRIIQLEQEISLLSQFEHKNIVQYYGTEKVESHLYIFTELVTKGSLLSLYQKCNLRDSQVSTYTRQILHGLKYLHDKDVVHRAIKCANILVDANGSVKLADFGLAKFVMYDAESLKGTAFWMAPELVTMRRYGLAVDIWSLGCTVLEMLTRRFPYPNSNCFQALFKIRRGELPPIPDSLSSDARDFILKCLQVEVNARPTASQLLDHPFVKPSSSGWPCPRSSRV